MSVSRVGKLKNSITIQSLSQGADGYDGYASPSYTTVITAFAKITPRVERKYLAIRQEDK